MARDFLGLNQNFTVKEEPDDETSSDNSGMRGSNLQWSFSNTASQLFSFKSAQERAASQRLYSPHFTQRNLPLDKQGGSQYPVTTSRQWHQSDVPPISRPSDGRVFPGAGQTNQSMYLAPNSSNLVTSTIGVATPMSAVTSTKGPVVGSTDLRSSPSISSGPCQLTIFYNGSVCVYDNVSPEKAQAIMLLAGNGDSTKTSAGAAGLSSTPKVQPQLSKVPSTDPAILTQQQALRLSALETAISNQSQVLRLSTNDTGSANQSSAQLLQSNISGSANQPPALRLQATGTGTANHPPGFRSHENDTVRVIDPPAMRLPSKDSSVSKQADQLSSSIVLPAPTTPSPVVASTSASQVNPIRPVVASVQAKCPEPSKPDTPVGTGGVKLVPSAVPQARKASLARFLEKRKERVIGAFPYPMSKNSSECNTLSPASSRHSPPVQPAQTSS